MKLALDKKQKRSLRNIIIAALLFAAGFALRLIPGSAAMIISSCVFAAAYIVVGLEILIKAFHGIIAGELLDENFLMSIASLGAFILGDFAEGVAVMLFYSGRRAVPVLRCIKLAQVDIRTARAARRPRPISNRMAR